MIEKPRSDTASFSWLASWRIYVQPASLRMLFLGFAAGLPLLLVVRSHFKHQIVQNLCKLAVVVALLFLTQHLPQAML